MSEEERRSLAEALNKRLKIFFIYGGVFIAFMIIFSRTPSKAYTEVNGVLVPINMNSFNQSPLQRNNYNNNYQYPQQ
jgi:hypothetical protein